MDRYLSWGSLNSSFAKRSEATSELGTRSLERTLLSQCESAELQVICVDYFYELSDGGVSAG